MKKLLLALTAASALAIAACAPGADPGMIDEFEPPPADPALPGDPAEPAEPAAP